jgi:hypothetical protein
MNKKIMSLLLASTLFVSFQMTPSGPAYAEDMANCTNVDNLVDVTPNHWAYDAVKYVTQEVCIMAPKTATRFMGNDVTTRYEVARAFYNAAKKLESTSGKDLKVTGDRRQVTLSDVDAANTDVVNSIINEYGIMQAMPGNKFMGMEKMSRYELAFELNNYLSLLEKKTGRETTDTVSRMENLTDIKEDHWATPAVRNIVNKYQLMVGYPDNTFKGYQTLTRYELAAVLRRFMEYVDRNLIPMATAEPTAMPSEMPSEEPTAMPSEMPVGPERVPLKTFDLKVGGSVKTAYVDETKKDLALLYGPNGRLDLRFGMLNVGLNADYIIYSNSFAATTGIQNLARLTAGGDIGIRILGSEYEDATAFVLSLGWDYLQWVGTGYSYVNHGPKGRAYLEIPIGGALSIIGEDQFQYFPWESKLFSNNILWKNDGFVGINIPAYTPFSFQIGYKDTRYSLVGKTTIYGDIGGLANLRFRF